ncbi:MAG: Ig-like domain-containing protein, partial [Oscillospiraceae bacterium]|nr:Ig-like domain-containing protein [Oscillospiraceae bacterium]
NDPDTYVDVKWSVSDPTFATVDDNGTVTILNKAGIITLIVTDKISGVSGAIVLRIT